MDCEAVKGTIYISDFFFSLVYLETSLSLVYLETSLSLVYLETSLVVDTEAYRLHVLAEKPVLRGKS